MSILPDLSIDHTRSRKEGGGDTQPDDHHENERLLQTLRFPQIPSPLSETPTVSKYHADGNGTSPTLSPIDAGVTPVPPIVDRAAGIAKQPSPTIGTLSEPKSESSKHSNRHNLCRRLSTVILPTMKCTQFITQKLGHIGRWWERHKHFNLWWWEATCCIVALGALNAMVATVSNHEHQPLPQWRYGLTVNAIIAICTVILKAPAGLVLAEGISHLKWISVAQPQSSSTFVAHDAASRGPWGALELIWKNQYLKARKNVVPLVSSLGALITVLILLLDPFSQ